MHLYRFVKKNSRTQLPFFFSLSCKFPFDGKLQKIRVTNIVPGDVIELKTGDIVMKTVLVNMVKHMLKFNVGIVIFLI